MHLEHDRSLKYVLSLGGGGYRGLFTIEFLRFLEADVGPLKGRLNLVAGTSAGSINAMGLAAGLSAEVIRDATLSFGESIFPPERIPFSGMLKQAVSHKRDAARLKQSLSELLGTTKLGETKVPAVASAVDLTAGQPRIFCPSFLGGRDDNVTLVDIVLASTAAPTYFPPHAIGPKLFVDGGLFANVPDLTAAVIATRATGWRSDQIRMLCVGTTFASTALAASAKTAALTGIDWGNPRNPILLQQIMSAQILFARECAQKIVGHEHYIAIDPAPSTDQEAVLGLDVATDAAKQTLQSMAQDSYEKFSREHARFIALMKSAA